MGHVLPLLVTSGATLYFLGVVLPFAPVYKYDHLNKYSCIY